MSSKDDTGVMKAAIHVDGDDEDQSNFTPGFMSAIMRRQVLRDMVKSLPEPVQGRISALKNVQLEQMNLEARFYEEVYNLEVKYQSLYDPLNEKRKLIVNGEYEPTAEEQEWKLDDNEEDEMSLKLAGISITKPTYPDDVKGIPDFWLTIFRATELISPMIQKPDEDVLKKLTDVSISYRNDPMSYVLEFHFAPNEFFTNLVLTKQYFLKVKLEAEHPFTFEGPEIYKCQGCAINWNKGKNLTVKTIKKKQKHKARGAVRTITKQVPADSFFNFFNPPIVEDEDKVDVEIQNILQNDYEIGHFLRSRIIPKALLYYTGDIVDDEDEDYDVEIMHIDALFLVDKLKEEENTFLSFH
ncbi:Nucleosome assembly protein 1-like 1, partial [Pseudolycoriella hygida]